MYYQHFELKMSGKLTDAELSMFKFHSQIVCKSIILRLLNPVNLN